MPDHVSETDGTVSTPTAAQLSYKIKIAKPLPSLTSHVLRQNPSNVNTLGINIPVGFAVNGVPFYSSLTSNNVEYVQGKGVKKAHDDCMGYYSSNNEYYYATAPPCLFATADGKGQGKDWEGKYDGYTFGNGFGEFIRGDDSRLRWSRKMEGAPFVIGIALDGYFIYSPFDSNGEEHTGLDNCNGKEYNGTYAYFSTLHFPYTVGCFGPGVTEDTVLNTTITTSSTTKCKPGRYARDVNHKQCLPCPAGRFNSDGGSCKNGVCDGFTDGQCSGMCEEGYFCPPGSSSPREQACGGVRYYCPEGSKERSVVDAGYYSTPLDEAEEFGEFNGTRSREGRKRMINSFTRTSQTICPRGYFCNGDGHRRACSAAGSYGNVTGHTNSSCNGACPLGHYCLPSVGNPIPCPAGTYGGETGLKSAGCSGLCDKGFYCNPNSTWSTQAACPAGRYGGEEGLKTEDCSSSCDGAGGNCDPTICEPGYYCPSGSVSGKENECGGEGVFCPSGSGTPTTATAGSYTTGSYSIEGKPQSEFDVTRRFDEAVCEKGRFCVAGKKDLCAPGRYGSSTGNIKPNCDGPCKEGYYCPEGSTSETQIRCGGTNFYCPLNSSVPLAVPEGYYSKLGGVDTRSDAEQCPAGSYCVNGVARLCPSGRYGETVGLKTGECAGPCKQGFYCEEGSTSFTQSACPVGRYGLGGSGDSTCSGKCKAGYYCTLGSWSVTQLQCGGDMVYCPEGSGLPLNVTVGSYSVGGNSTTRVGEEVCAVAGHVTPAGVYTVKNDAGDLNGCPSRTRSENDVGVRPRPAQLIDIDVVTDILNTPGQHVHVDYNIDPENEFKYEQGYPGNV
ncbi:hypothetical protein TL16_g09137 [Triparma laevis f. inornata]|nr:hypothetical protein TL16_g09137 [Triparma laevis f. inornata]